MTLVERIRRDALAAMKTDQAKSLVLRTVLGEIQTQEKAGKMAREFTDAEVEAILAKEVKKWRDVADLYAANPETQERARAERADADLIAAYLPTPLTEAEIAALVDEKIAETGATTMKEMGKVIKAVVEAAGSRADGRTVSTLVRGRLSA